MTSRPRICLLLREHGVSGGAETVNLHLVTEFLEMVDRIIWIMPRWRRDYFQKFFPPSDRLIYVEPEWPDKQWVLGSFDKAVRFCLRRKNIPGRAQLEVAERHLSNRWLSKLIREHEITHCFCNWTLWVDAPAVDIPLGAMLMDVRWRHFPETFPGGDLDRIDRQFQQWLKRSDIVFPVSETTAADIKRFYPWYNGPMMVVPHGAETAPPSRAVSSAPVDRDGSRPVFYCPGVAHAHKDHITLFRGAAAVRKKGYDFNLVLTGIATEQLGADQASPDPEIEACRTFLAEHKQLFGDRIKPLGYIDRAEVEALYQTCAAVILPSFFEGFGLSLLEALENGAAVICSDIPAHREQLVRYRCIDDVSLVPPRDAIALAERMEQVLLESRNRAATKRSTPPALGQWTWRDAATAYLDSLAAITK